MRILIVCVSFFASIALSQEVITTEDAATFTIEVLPSPSEFGRPAKIVLEVRPQNSESLNYRLQAGLSMAMFVAGSHGAKRVGTDPGIRSAAVEWPQLSIVAHGSQRIELDVILRDDKQAAMLVDFELTNLSNGERQRANFRVDPIWPESTSSATWSGLIMLFALAIVTAVVAGYPLSRVIFARTGGGARGGTGAAVSLVIPILTALIFMLIIFDEIRVFTSFQESTCTVTDRVVETVTTSSTSMEPNMSWTEGRRRSLRYAAFVAVNLELPGGTQSVVWNSGENGSDASGSYDWVEEVTEPYDPGTTFPCWYNGENPNSLALTRSISWGFYLTMLVILMLPRLVARMIGTGASNR